MWRLLKDLNVVERDWEQAILKQKFLRNTAPIFENQGDLNQAANYRPKFVLPYVSKIVETCVKHQFLKYVNINKLITHIQMHIRKPFHCYSSPSYSLGADIENKGIFR